MCVNNQIVLKSILFLGPKSIELDIFQQSQEKLVFYKCQYCPFFTMQSDLMDNHMEQPPDECVKAQSEKQMKQQVIYSPRMKFNPTI